MAKELWEIMKGPGQPPCFNSPEEMWERAIEYFKWCGNNVILEDKIFKMKDPTGGDSLEHDYVMHKRPMTVAGLCIFLNIDRTTWYNYKKNPQYFNITKAIDETMFEQKFSGAATGQFNANIIARDLGLTDKQEIKMDNANVVPWDDIGEADE
ncbi:putative DNA-packaging protein [Vibrio phage PS34B.2]|nr:putative DNA-packaging protein [Vibrio phage PS34B.2]